MGQLFRFYSALHDNELISSFKHGVVSLEGVVDVLAVNQDSSNTINISELFVTVESLEVGDIRADNVSEFDTSLAWLLRFYNLSYGGSSVHGKLRIDYLSGLAANKFVELLSEESDVLYTESHRIEDSVLLAEESWDKEGDILAVSLVLVLDVTDALALRPNLDLLAAFGSVLGGVDLEFVATLGWVNGHDLDTFDLVVDNSVLDTSLSSWGVGFDTFE